MSLSSAIEHRAPNGVMRGSDDYRRVAEKARRVAAAIRSLGIVPPQGELLDVRAALAAVGVHWYAAYPSLPPFADPLEADGFYASSLTPDCPGLAIAVVWKLGDPNGEDPTNLSVVWDDGGVAFRSVVVSRDELLQLIFTIQAELGCKDS
jgi:hypothetical protein